jgi:hypothetical protein
LGDLAPRAILRERLQDAVLCGELSACHHLGRTGTFGYVGGAARLGPRRHGQYIVGGARAPQRWCTTESPRPGQRHANRRTRAMKNKGQ